MLRETLITASALAGLTALAVHSVSACDHASRDGAVDPARGRSPGTGAEDGGRPSGAARRATPAGSSAPNPPAPAGGAQCPADMVATPGACVDRFEIAIVDVATERALSPHYPVLTRYDGWVRERKREARVLGAPADGDGTTDAPPWPALESWQERGEFDAKAMTRAGVLPSGYLSMPVLRGACERAGKRLCTRGEWRNACRGAGGTRFPYGAAYARGRCNFARGMHPARAIFGDPSATVLDPRLNLVTLEGAPLLARSGAFDECASVWDGDAIYDMVGNLDEWIDDPKGAFVGGSYVRYLKTGCDTIVRAHPPGYLDYSTGGRCCRDLE